MKHIYAISTSNSTPGHVCTQKWQLRSTHTVTQKFIVVSFVTPQSFLKTTQMSIDRTMWYLHTVHIMEYYSVFFKQLPAHASIWMNLKNTVKQKPGKSEHIFLLYKLKGDKSNPW